MNKRALQDTNETVIEKIQIYSEDEPLRKRLDLEEIDWGITKKQTPLTWYISYW